MKPARLKVPARTRSLSRIRTFVRAQCRRYGLGMPETDDMVLAVDEACANIALHAYGAPGQRAGKAGRVIEIGTDPVRRGIEVRIRDRGGRFNPLALPGEDMEERARRGDKNGRGVFAIRAFTDRAVHRWRAGEGNELILRKYRAAAAD